MRWAGLIWIDRVGFRSVSAIPGSVLARLWRGRKAGSAWTIVVCSGGILGCLGFALLMCFRRYILMRLLIVLVSILAFREQV